MIEENDCEKCKIINQIINIKELSLGARGLLIFMLDNKERLGMSILDLGSETNTARTKINNLIKELFIKGYITRELVRENGKVKGILYRTNIKGEFKDLNKAIPTKREKSKEIKNKCCVYCHTFPNGKKYYGITQRNPAERRWNKGMGYKENVIMFNDIKKFGWDSIKHEIIYNYMKRKFALYCEYSLIIKDKTYLNENGYNMDTVDIIHFINTNAKTEDDKQLLGRALEKIANTNIETLIKNQKGI